MLINIFASLGFQSTLPQGERLVSVTCLGTVGIFQSTLPQGERPPHPCTSSWHRYFNPRSRKGSDGNIHHHPVIYFRFQSTLPQGERQQAIKSLVIDGFISIHAPARGATNHGYRFLFRVRFQSTLPQGERLCTRVRCKRPDKISIHAPARGATNSETAKVNKNCYFNPRSRKGSDCTMPSTT